MEIEKKLTVEFTVPPTILHAGMFLAEKKGYYRDEGIQVKMNWPSNENNTGKEDLKTAVTELQRHGCDLMVGGFSTVIHYSQLCREKVPLVAISSFHPPSVTPKGATGIATLTSSGIDSLKKLDNKKVALLGFPFEEGLVREMIKSDGGSGNANFESPPVQHLYDGLKERKYEAAHIAIPWHGVKAKRDNVDLKIFKLDDYRVPPQYPCFVTLKDMINGPKRSIMSSFLRATAKGYCDFLKDDPRKIAEQLKECVRHENMKDVDFIQDAIQASREYLGGRDEHSRWGMMREEDWKTFVRYLAEKRLLVTEDGRSINENQINISSLFTNDLIQGNF